MSQVHCSETFFQDIFPCARWYLVQDGTWSTWYLVNMVPGLLEETKILIFDTISFFLSGSYEHVSFYISLFALHVEQMKSRVQVIQGINNNLKYASKSQ